MTCPSVAPDTDIACTLDDEPGAHQHGHTAPTHDGQGRISWGVDRADYERWDTEVPEQIVEWEADAEAAAAAEAEEPAPAE